MASNSTHQIAFKITDVGNGMQNLIVNAKDLAKVFKQSAEEAKKLQSKAIDFAALATGIDWDNVKKYVVKYREGNEKWQVLKTVFPEIITENFEFVDYQESAARLDLARWVVQQS